MGYVSKISDKPRYGICPLKESGEMSYWLSMLLRDTFLENETWEWWDLFPFIFLMAANPTNTGEKFKASSTIVILAHTLELP